MCCAWASARCLMGYQDTPLPFACLACCWASVLIQLLRFNSGSHWCLALARPSAKLLCAARLLFLCTRLCIDGLHNSPRLDAAVTTAPHAAAFLAYSLVIASLCEPQNVPNAAFFTTNQPHWWHYFSRRTSVGILFSSHMMSAGIYTLAVLTLTTEDPNVLHDLAQASTMWHVNCFLVLAAELGWLARGQASRGIPVACYGAAVAVRSVLDLFCGCLCVQAGVTALAYGAPRWFSRHFAMAQGLYLTAELLPVLALSAASPAVDARAAAERPRRAWGLRDALVRGQLRRRLFPRAESGAPPPLAQAVLCSLEPTWLAADADDSCSICLERMCKGEEALQLSCQHAFHAACLRPWLARSGSCPLCKHAVDESCTRPAGEERRHARRARSGAFLTTRTVPGLVLEALLLLVVFASMGVAALLVAGIVLGAPPAAVHLATDW